MASHTHVTTYQKIQVRLGGSRGNEILTSVNAAVLVALLAVQLVTVLALDSMIRVHLFVGVVLLGPVALKLGTTGYRFLRYYTGAREYREKGPPPTLLRAIAPVFVAATISLFATGVVMLIDGQSEGAVRGLHVASFWVWIGCFVVHIVFNSREVLRNLHGEWFSRARMRVAGAQVRGVLVLASMFGGVLVALALASKITGYHMGD
jgi:FtsH-binding integral membrane protein